MTQFIHGADYPEVTIFKLSGKLLQSESLLTEVLLTIKDWCLRSGQRAVIVHGGGLYCDKWCDVFELATEKNDGMRVTSSEQLPVISGALAGYAHTKVLAACKRADIDPVGMTPTTGDTLRCHLHPKHAVLGRVGTVTPNDPTLVFRLLLQGYFPVFHSLAIDNYGECLNVNADDIAVALANCLSVRKLVLLTDTNGLLDQSGETISDLNGEQLQSLTQQPWVSKGMKAKLQAIANLLSVDSNENAQNSSSLSQVIIASGLSPELLTEALNGNGDVTTLSFENQSHSPGDNALTALKEVQS